MTHFYILSYSTLKRKQEYEYPLSILDAIVFFNFKSTYFYIKNTYTFIDTTYKPSMYKI